MNRRTVFHLVASLSLFTTIGCSHLGFGPTFRMEAEETLTLSAGDVATLNVRTHNGAVTAAGSDDTDGQFVVHVTKRGRAWTQEGAEQALEAIEVTTERRGDTQTLSWRWQSPRQYGWGASVAFNIQTPRDVAIGARTHNGRLTVTDIVGDCELSTHNGSIHLASQSRNVNVQTHNGGIRVASAPEEFRAVTHNGTIRAELRGEHNVTGDVRTHNGSVTLVMNPAASANFDCGAHNGGIHSKLNLSNIDVSRRKLTGRFGDATGALRINTHNGSITLSSAE